MKLKKLISTCLALVLLSACSTSSPFKSLTAGACSGEQKQLVDDHISSQISAISKQDWPLAYSFAAKSFQDSIDLTSFEVIITDSYSFLIDNQGITFGGCEIKEDKIFQEVTVNSSNGKIDLSYRLSTVDEKLGVEAANLAEQSTALTT
ncbi:DUF4864 domain-containing protein [Candidatus Nanopelagicus abundans]|uniref:DUF4864 domain-containing protein n=1 Tax=Candidatus Nanopelagicus abundans TaxID=1884916 RepID=A0A249L3J6_9ACTN|nr:DUF4864 domain-containing protein [Candidatus Nanopelagicus abundans]ASY23658.1 DUF4864 domain-containing protein [Candidatus Nanopelagicus abundans]